MVQVFISHASGDPDWSETDVVALAQALKDRGIKVWLDVWKQEERHQSEDEWRTWMRAGLDAADHVLCLASAVFELRTRREHGATPTGRGVALEAYEIEQIIYDKKQRNNGWAWLIFRDGCDQITFTPRILRGQCPPYSLPSEEDKLLHHLSKILVRPGEDDRPKIEGVLSHQANLAIALLEDAPLYWKFLQKDDYDGEPPPAGALISPAEFVQWILKMPVANQNKVMDLFLVLSRFFGKDNLNKTGLRQSQKAAAGLYSLVACRLVDTPQLKVFGDMAIELGSNAPFVCALVATARFGGKLELGAAAADGLPQPDHVYSVQLAMIDDQFHIEFDRAAYCSLFSDSEQTQKISESVGPLTPAELKTLKTRIRYIRGSDRKTFVLMVNLCPDLAVASKFSDTYKVPVFLPSKELAIPLLGMTVEDLLEDIKVFWERLGDFESESANSF